MSSEERGLLEEFKRAAGADARDESH
jgi:hypothetical protein